MDFHKTLFVALITLFLLLPINGFAGLWLSGQYGVSGADNASFKMMGGDLGFTIQKDKAGLGVFYLQSDKKSSTNGSTTVSIHHTMYGVEAMAIFGIAYVGGKFALDRYCGSASVLGTSRINACQNYLAMGPTLGLNLSLLGPLSIGAEASGFVGLGAPMYIMWMGLGFVRLTF